MKFSLFLIPAVAAALQPIEFEYYPDANCKSGSLSAVKITEAKKCYNLSSDGLSFHIGGPSTQAQVPKGCTITGYSDAGCKGSVNTQVVGPSGVDKCYIVGVNMGQKNPVKSVILTCK